MGNAGGNTSSSGRPYRNIKSRASQQAPDSAALDGADILAGREPGVEYGLGDEMNISIDGKDTQGNPPIQLESVGTPPGPKISRPSRGGRGTFPGGGF